MPIQLTFLSSVSDTDLLQLRSLVAATGFFNDEEVAIACELAEENARRGEESGYHFLLAHADGRLVGYTCYGPIPATLASFDLYWIVVHPQYQGRGIGKALLRQSEDVIAGQGGRRVYIETSSRELYNPTRAFYLSAGYCEEAVLRDFYRPGDSKVIFSRELPLPSNPELKSREAGLIDPE